MGGAGHPCASDPAHHDAAAAVARDRPPDGARHDDRAGFTYTRRHGCRSRHGRRRRSRKSPGAQRDTGGARRRSGRKAPAPAGRAEQGPCSRRGDARATTKAGLVDHRRAGPTVTPARLKQPRQDGGRSAREEPPHGRVLRGRVSRQTGHVPWFRLARLVLHAWPRGSRTRHGAPELAPLRSS